MSGRFRFGVILACLLALAAVGAPSRGQEKPAATRLPTVPATGAPAVAAPAPAEAGEERKTKIEILVQEKRYTVDLVDADIREVIRQLSQKSGVEIQVFEGVKGKVTLHLEGAPLEKVVDDLLSAVGQRNYLMVFDGDGLTKMSIVPKDGGGKGLSEAAKRLKVKGKLKTGKEIEYYPGEIVVMLQYCPETRPEIAEKQAALIGRLERDHGLSFISSSCVADNTAVRYRVLGGRDVLQVRHQVEETGLTVGSSPNGLGPSSLEFPENFQVLTHTPEQRKYCAAQKLLRNDCLKHFNLFLRDDDVVGQGNSLYSEGMFFVLARDWDAALTMASEVGGIPVDAGKIYIPNVTTPEDHRKALQRLRDLWDKYGFRGAGVNLVFRLSAQ